MELEHLYIDRLLALVLDQTGTDLTGYRRPALSWCISHRLSQLGKSEDQYLAFCQNDEGECRELRQAISVNVSSFFRDPIVFEILAQSIIPDLMARNGDLRIWSAGCAAGEEAYSVAILILEALEAMPGAEVNPLIFATDIDQEVLAKAATAFYPPESLADTKLRIVETYFSPVRDGFELCPEARNMVHFSSGDLLSPHTFAPADSIFGSFDIVLCRNTMIYFSTERQARVMMKLYQTLEKGGHLILGESEVVGRNLKPQFETVNARNKIFRKER
ncbi:MAG: protein-glutamate O-methyltransferase CheR [Deltaproteobacteria bacterium]|nr:protein-glutamate O-methyltransferase CheR [Deltaproteobacteria bacterium]